MSSDNWYYVEEGSSVGPVDKATLRKRFKEGLLKRDSLVWHEGSPDWTPAGEIPGLIPPPIPKSAIAPVPLAQVAEPKHEPNIPPSRIPERHAEPIMSHAHVNTDLESSVDQPIDINDVAQRVEPPGTSQSLKYGYAGFWLRFMAFFVDCIVHFMVMFSIFFAVGRVLAADGSMETWSDEDWSSFNAFTNFSSILIWWLYFAGMESSRFQGTLGKILVGIKVTDLNGRPVCFGRATGRHFAKFVSALILGVGFLMVAFTRKKQALHDSIARCLVLKK